MLLAGCCVASWSRTQASYALSSCEAELHAMGSAAVGVLGVHAFLLDQLFAKEPPVVWGDSSSALQLAHRKGTGRLKRVPYSHGSQRDANGCRKCTVLRT